MISRKPKSASLKVDLDIHKKIKFYKERGLINQSITEFVNQALNEKLDNLGRGQTDRIMREKLDEITASMIRTEQRIGDMQELKRQVTQTEKRLSKAVDRILKKKK